MTTVCVDTGGTFTDFVVLDGESITTFKIPSTPANPAQAVLQGLSRVAGTLEVRHGTTVATNAILERKLARTAFVTNEGFRDLLFLARQTRPDLYDLEPLIPAPPVARENCFGVPGRLLPDGSVLTELCVDKLHDLSDYEAVAICLLYAYVNPEHELAIAKTLRASQFVSLSHQVSPEFREYERASTTALNAAIGPKVNNYLEELSNSVADGEVLVMGSAGGLLKAADAMAVPIRTATSGPAAGVVAAKALGLELGYKNLIAFDMGGTSTDVTLIADLPMMSSQGEIAGLPIRQNRIDIHTVGCGGGSIAWLDEAGALQVGPQSAGAFPGPALYGNSDLFTVTDANYLLGRIDSDSFGGGSITLDRTGPSRAAKSLCSALRCNEVALTNAVIERAEHGMGAAIRRVSSARGHDPSSFVLVAFGGSGGLHACSIAEALQIETVFVPRAAGVFSAIGLAMSPLIGEEWRSVIGTALQENWLEAFCELEAAALRRLDVKPSSIEWSADFRYKGQSHEVSVIVGRDRTAAERVFVAAHEERYGVSFPDRKIEWVSARVRAERSSEMRFPKLPVSALAPTKAGPMTLSFEDSTIYVPAGWRIELVGDVAYKLTRDVIG